MSQAKRVYSVKPGSVLDVGAGENPDERADYVADLYDLPGVDVAFDITDAWPFDDGAFEGIVARHVFEHVDHGTLRERVFPEAARVLESDGWLEMTVPLGCDAVADPTHRSRWAWRTPLFYADGHRHWAGDTGFTDVDRRLHCWMIQPLEVLTPALRFAAKRWPMETWYEFPGATGELICTFRQGVDE